MKYIRHITVRSGKPIRPLPAEVSGAVDPQLRIDPTIFLGSEHNRRTLFSAENDSSEWASRVRRVFAAALMKSYRSGGKPGRKRESTAAVNAHIRKLKSKYPKLTAAALYPKADRKIIKGMAAGTFRNHFQALKKK